MGNRAFALPEIKKNMFSSLIQVKNIFPPPKIAAGSVPDLKQYFRHKSWKKNHDDEDIE